MVVNTNPETGIAYGYIASQALDDDLIDMLVSGPQSTDETAQAAFKEWSEEFQEANGREPDDGDSQSFWDSFECSEPTVSGEYQGVSYSTSWLGGALNFFIFKSPFTTDKARMASPCVPNCGILDTLDGSVTSYDVPADWRRQEEMVPVFGVWRDPES